MRGAMSAWNTRGDVIDAAIRDRHLRQTQRTCEATDIYLFLCYRTGRIYLPRSTDICQPGPPALPGTL
jgi:hypothetical protein